MNTFEVEVRIIDGSRRGTRWEFEVEAGDDWQARRAAVRKVFGSRYSFSPSLPGCPQIGRVSSRGSQPGTTDLHETVRVSVCEVTP